MCYLGVVAPIDNGVFRDQPTLIFPPADRRVFWPKCQQHRLKQWRWRLLVGIGRAMNNALGNLRWRRWAAGLIPRAPEELPRRLADRNLSNGDPPRIRQLCLWYLKKQGLNNAQAILVIHRELHADLFELLIVLQRNAGAAGRIPGPLFRGDSAIPGEVDRTDAILARFPVGKNAIEHSCFTRRRRRLIRPERPKEVGRD
jgi:hypothetical protein